MGGWQAGGSWAEARRRCTEEMCCEEPKRWSRSPFDAELVWAARFGMDLWLKGHSGLDREKNKIDYLFILYNSFQKYSGNMEARN